MGLCKNHDALYFDTLNRTKKSETVLSLIYSTYYATGNTPDERKSDIARRLVEAYRTLKGDAGSYSGGMGQFSSQYTIGHEMGIWKNSQLDLTDYAVEVAENKITIKDYFDRAFLNYIQPVNGKIVHLLYHLLKYMNDKGLNEVSKTEMASIYKSVSGSKEDGQINGAFNMLLGSNYFYDKSSSVLEYIGTETISELMKQCNLKYVEEGYAQALIDLDTQDKYAKYLLDVKSTVSPINSANNNVALKNKPLQQIFYGAPGTGKSYTVDGMCKAYRHRRTTFHPDSDYSTFVGAYKPIKENVDSDKYGVGKLRELYSEFQKNYPSHCISRFVGLYADSFLKLTREDAFKVFNGFSADSTINQILDNAIPQAEITSGLMNKRKSQISYTFVPQAFTNAYIDAWKNPKEPVFLVIEEINRGNCAQIFGDLFQLLDRTEEGYSSYPIDADTDLQSYLCNEFAETDIEDADIKSGAKLLLPPNLYIWATMNTSDQSLFPIDSAFKRRWDWKYVPIDTTKENWNIEVDNKWYSWTSFLNKINFEIEDTTSSEDKKLGFYFCKAKDDVISAEKFVSKVLFYLYNDVFGDYGFERDFFKHKDGELKDKKITFQSLYKMDGNVNETSVAELLNNLGVEFTEIGIDDDKEEPDDTLGENSKRQVKFWQGFNAARESNDVYKNLYTEKTPSARKYMDLSFGSGDYHPTMSAVFTKNVIRCGIWIKPKERKDEIFAAFKNHEAEINALVGDTMYFDDQKPNAYSINVERAFTDLTDEANWPDAYEWLMDMAVKMNEIKEKYGI